MDLKYLAVKIILIIYGFVGTLFNIIICTIATFPKCKGNEKEIKISDYFCKIKDPATNNTYYASFNVYFHTTDKPKEIIIEIIVEIIALISFYYYKYYSMMIIKYLSPIHLIFLLPSFYLFRKLIHIIVDTIIFIFKKGDHKIMDFTAQDYLKEKFILNISADVFSFIVFLIYLEIIELNCFNLNYNLRSRIMTRSRTDSMIADNKELLQINQDDEDEDEEN